MYSLRNRRSIIATQETAKIRKLSRSIKRYARKDPEAPAIFASRKWQDFATPSKQNRLVFLDTRPENPTVFESLILEIKSSLAQLAKRIEKAHLLYKIRSSTPLTMSRFAQLKNNVPLFSQDLPTEEYAKKINKTLKNITYIHSTSLTPEEADQAYDILCVMHLYYQDINNAFYRSSELKDVQEVLKKGNLGKYLTTDLAWLVHLSEKQTKDIKDSFYDRKGLIEWQKRLYDYYRDPENNYKLSLPRDNVFRSIWGKTSQTIRSTPFNNKSLSNIYNKLEKLRDHIQDTPREYTVEEEYALEIIYKTHIPDGINAHIVTKRDTPDKVKELEEDLLQIFTQAYEDVVTIMNAHKAGTTKDVTQYVKSTKKLLNLKA